MNTSPTPSKEAFVLLSLTPTALKSALKDFNQNTFDTLLYKLNSAWAEIKEDRINDKLLQVKAIMSEIGISDSQEIAKMLEEIQLPTPVKSTKGRKVTPTFGKYIVDGATFYAKKAGMATGDLKEALAKTGGSKKDSFVSTITEEEFNRFTK